MKLFLSRMKRTVCSFITSVIACSLLLLSYPSLATDLSAGYQWLASQQQTDGSFKADKSVATNEQALAEAVYSLSISDNGSLVDRNAAISRLVVNKYWSAEAIALYSQISSESDKGVLLKNLLLKRQHANGGFGSFDGYDSTVIDTAFALIALSNFNVADRQIVGSSIQYLLNTQQPDGSFRQSESNHSSLYLTAVFSKALQLYMFEYQVGTAIEKANTFLTDNQLSSGGWGESWVTSTILQALIPVLTDNTQYTKSLDQLANEQDESGSWYGDVYTTALALQALYLSANLVKPVEPTKGSIVGTVISAENRQPIKGVAISVEGPDTISVTTNESGQFTISPLTAGDYQVSYQKAGFGKATQTLSLKKGQIASVGAVALTVLPTEGVLTGIISDGETGAPLAGVVVTVNELPPVITDINGEYVIHVATASVAISVSSEDYQPISAAGTVPLGTKVIFSPQLFKQVQPDIMASIVGTLIDEKTLEPVAAARVVNAGSDEAAITNELGMFELITKKTNIKLVFSADGYKAGGSTLLVAAGTRVEIGEFLMTPMEVTSGSTISGFVRDKATGDPISGAMSEIGTESLSTISDHRGYFEITDISGSEVTLFTKADGYLSKLTEFGFAGQTHIVQDVLLNSSSQEGVKIVGINSNDTSIGAYSPIDLTFTIENAGNEAKNILIVAEVVDVHGNTLSQKTLNSAAGVPGESALVPLLPGKSIEKSASWFTGIAEPGRYAFRIRAYDGISTRILTERALPFFIEVTSHLEELSIIPRPQFGHVGQTVELDFIGRLENRSNVPVYVNMGYALQSPEGDIVMSGVFETTIEPDTMSYSIPFKPIEHVLQIKGEYRVEVAVHSKTMPEVITSKVIEVSPMTRLNLTQDIEPKQVIPNGNQRVSIKINLEGVE
ncbi:carboxypeptidase regulatory-like domain-containing protein [Photobacterium indicum]|uniref:carboxypeptidase regulatory-like domain-containing protein n=1 Tax=Photobacterium indicum TaxID=81447 RepID=UPI003D0E88AE